MTAHGTGCREQERRQEKGGAREKSVKDQRGLQQGGGRGKRPFGSPTWKGEREAVRSIPRRVQAYSFSRIGAEGPRTKVHRELLQASFFVFILHPPLQEPSPGRLLRSVLSGSVCGASRVAAWLPPWLPAAASRDALGHQNAEEVRGHPLAAGGAHDLGEDHSFQPVPSFHRSDGRDFPG